MARVTFALLAVALVLAPAALAQQPGKQQADEHPPLTYNTCTTSGGCQSQNGNIVLDSNWMWAHNVGSYHNCFTGNQWSSQYCPDPDTCAKTCALDAASYEGTYGISTSGDQVRLNYVTTQQYGTNVGSRTYLMDTPTTYKMFMLKNQEFTFDVDVSQLVCGLNGALYFVAMDADGGMSKYPNNNAGAAYGTGYCDAQCPHDLKFINGAGNVLDWQSSPSDPNSGTGKYGTCCPEMDIWEGNVVSTAVTAHPCTVTSQTQCSGQACGDNDKGQRYAGICDKDGGDFNPFRLGDKTFYGSGADFAIDTTQKMTVVTQFLTADNTTTGDLVEIRRLYVQNGKVIQQRPVTVGGKQFDSITDDFVDTAKTAFNDTNSFQSKGSLKGMGAAMDNGMVLVMSLWSDDAAHMLWLDSDYPTTEPATNPGVARGTCATTSGVPKDLIKNDPNAYVTYSNIKFGDIGSTYGQ